jgi:hypothetical protein
VLVESVYSPPPQALDLNGGQMFSVAAAHRGRPHARSECCLNWESFSPTALDNAGACKASTCDLGTPVVTLRYSRPTAVAPGCYQRTRGGNGLA